MSDQAIGFTIFFTPFLAMFLYWVYRRDGLKAAVILFALIMVFLAWMGTVLYFIFK